MKIAVNNDVKIPMIKVVANPLIGPVPNTNKIIAVKPVVILATDATSIPFDASNYRVIYFDYSASGIELLKKKIVGTVNSLFRDANNI